jgi:low affinity Fe/Cu permease
MTTMTTMTTMTITTMTTMTITTVTQPITTMTTMTITTVMTNNNAELLNKMDEFIKKQDQSNEVLRGIHKNQPKEFAVNLETTKFGTAINTTSYKTT